MIKYLFRAPKFPVICDTPEILIGAENHDELEEQIKSLRNFSEEQFSLIDSSNEGWVLYTDLMVVSPLAFEKVWTKKKVIDLFNKSQAAKKLEYEYPMKSISSKRFDRIFNEIVLLIKKANDSIQN